MVFAERKYYDAIWIMPPVSVSAFFMFMYSLFCNVEFYYEKNKFVTVATCTGAAANILLNYIFINLFGYFAAGYTTLACYIILAVAHYLFHKRVIRQKKLGIKAIYNVRFMMMCSVIILAVMVLITFTYSYFYIRYSIILALVIVAIIKRKWAIGLLKEIKKGKKED